MSPIRSRLQMHMGLLSPMLVLKVVRTCLIISDFVLSSSLILIDRVKLSRCCMFLHKSGLFGHCYFHYEGGRGNNGVCQFWAPALTWQEKLISEHAHQCTWQMWPDWGLDPRPCWCNSRGSTLCTDVGTAVCSISFFSRIAIQSIERKRMLEQACRLSHLLVSRSVGLSDRWIWKNGWLDLEAIWGGKWGRSKDDVLDGVEITQGEGAILWVNLGCSVVTNRDFVA